MHVSRIVTNIKIITNKYKRELKRPASTDGPAIRSEGNDDNTIGAKMKVFVQFVAVFQLCKFVMPEIRSSVFINKLVKVKPVGGVVAKKFVPLTEIPPPHVPHKHGSIHSGRRHLEDECSQRPPPREVHDGGLVEMFGDYYDDKVAKTVATVIIPDHIDYKHFQVTTQVPYLTLGPIEAIGYHPSTMRSEHPNECEKIYQDHIADLYSDEEPTDMSEESLEMAKVPLFLEKHEKSLEDRLAQMYEDVDM